MPPFLEVIKLRFNFASLDAKGFLNIKTEEKDLRIADIPFKILIRQSQLAQKDAIRDLFGHFRLQEYLEHIMPKQLRKDTFNSDYNYWSDQMKLFDAC